MEVPRSVPAKADGEALGLPGAASSLCSCLLDVCRESAELFSSAKSPISLTSPSGASGSGTDIDHAVSTHPSTGRSSSSSSSDCSVSSPSSSSQSSSCVHLKVRMIYLFHHTAVVSVLPRKCSSSGNTATGSRPMRTRHHGFSSRHQQRLTSHDVEKTISPLLSASEVELYSDSCDSSIALCICPASSCAFGAHPLSMSKSVSSDAPFP